VWATFSALAGAQQQQAAQQQQKRQQQQQAQGQSGRRADGDQEAADGEGGEAAPPVDDRTWLQKNWLIVLAGATMVGGRQGSACVAALAHCAGTRQLLWLQLLQDADHNSAALGKHTGARCTVDYVLSTAHALIIMPPHAVSEWYAAYAAVADPQHCAEECGRAPTAGRRTPTRQGCAEEGGIVYLLVAPSDVGGGSCTCNIMTR